MCKKRISGERICGCIAQNDRRGSATTGSIYSRYGGKEGLFSAIVEPVAREFTEKFVSVQERFDATDPDKQAKQGEVTALIGPSFWMKQRRLWM